ncbi:MAG: hypothetical protein JW841_11115 [Deltaproteobacteria bacterium]|nr:hypothetical protein [Deltaproteobacteria bacterium]
MAFPGQKHPGYTAVALTSTLRNIIPYVEFFVSGQAIVGRSDQIGLFDSDPYTDLIPLPRYTFTGGLQLFVGDDSLIANQ